MSGDTDLRDLLDVSELNENAIHNLNEKKMIVIGRDALPCGVILSWDEYQRFRKLETEYALLLEGKTQSALENTSTIPIETVMDNLGISTDDDFD